jgi:hypothetical protein
MSNVLLLEDVMNSSLPILCHLWAAALLSAISIGTAYGGYAGLDQQADGQYDYGIQIDANHGLVILAGDEITLSGLSGVTGPSVLPDLSFAYSLGTISATSVIIVDPTPFILDPLPVSPMLSALRATSSATTTGLVDYNGPDRKRRRPFGNSAGPVAAAASVTGACSANRFFALKRTWKPSHGLQFFVSRQLSQYFFIR